MLANEIRMWIAGAYRDIYREFCTYSSCLHFIRLLCIFKLKVVFINSPASRGETSRIKLHTLCLSMSKEAPV